MQFVQQMQNLGLLLSSIVAFCLGLWWFVKTLSNAWRCGMDSGPGHAGNLALPCSGSEVLE